MEAMKEAEKVKKRLEPFGYMCKVTEDEDTVSATCSPTEESFARDKINKIEVLLPKRENLTNIEIQFQAGYEKMNPIEIKKIIGSWFSGSIISYESHVVGVEFSARQNAHAIIADIIRERRKPLVLP